MEKYNLISHDELSDAIENDPSENNFRTAAEFLMSAITDWPGVQEPKDLVAALRSEIKDQLILGNLEEYLDRLNPAYDAWKMESVSALVELFDFERGNNFDPVIELEATIERITLHYRK